MTYSVDLYENTGFNQNNIPDSPVRLGQPFMTKTAIDVIQNRVISSINIKVNNFDEIKNVDYCKLGDFYYIVNDVTMQAHDVATLHLAPDFISSAGGVDNIEFLDGITSRHHVSDDSFGKYVEEDPLLVCQRPLKVINGGRHFTEDVAPFLNTIVMSTANLYEMGKGELQAKTYTDDIGNSVTVPSLRAAKRDTPFTIRNCDRDFTVAGQMAFKLEGNDTVKDGIQYCRDINAESAIISQYVLPVINASVESFQDEFTRLANLPSRTPAEQALLDTLTQIKQEIRENTVYKIYGAVNNKAIENLPLIFDDNVKNKRVMYGELCKFGMVTSNGNQCEFNPERLISSLTQTEDENYVNVVMVCDPRPDGRPYFRFQFVDGMSAVTDLDITSPSPNDFSVNPDFWRGSIPGEGWFQLPLVFTSAQGTEIAEKYYKQQYKLDKFINNKQEALMWGEQLQSSANSFGQTYDQFGNKPDRVLSSSMTTTNSTRNYDRNTKQGTIDTTKVASRHEYLAPGGPAPMSGGIIGAAANILLSPLITSGRQNVREASYEWNVDKNLYDLAISQSVVVPEVATPYSKGTIRDFYGNGVLVYRYRPEDTDLAIQDKLLTMYGYKVTEPLKKEFFNNREYFNYIQLNSASIGGDLPQWFKGGILQQLGNGVRIWHTKPNESYYNNNPIKE